ncbi:MAG: T9SS type A sorting domain-containing protein [bacterium]|nr:T9SS type A sorting domain-containing protein [Candidatus Limimorpha equi]
MKNIYRMFLTVALMVGIVSANAQNHQPNRCTITNGNRSYTVEASVNTMINKVSENIVTTSIGGIENNSVRANAETHNLFIRPEGDWNAMRIIGPNGFMQYIMVFMQDEFNAAVEEGDYIIFIEGQKTVNGQQALCWLGYEINVSQDVTMNPSFDEARFHINIEGKDENGNSVQQNPCIDNYLEIFVGFKEYGAGMSYPVFDGNSSDVLCNELGDSFTVAASQRINVENQTAYFINYPTHFGKLDGDLLMSNDPSELKSDLFYFNLRNNNSGNNISFYSVDFTRYCISQNSNTNYWTAFQGWNLDLTFDPSLPIRIVTDNIIEDPSVNYDYGFCVVKPYVTVYENHTSDPTQYVSYSEQMVSPGVYMNNEHKWIREPFGNMPYLYNLKAMEYFDPMIQTPAANVVPMGQPNYLGERTPILYYQAENFNASTSLYGMDYLAGQMQFISDNGCIRKSDECAIVTIMANGNEIFNDSLYRFNENFMFPVEGPCAVDMEITDNYLIDDGVEKFNNTRISFDLNRDDAMPPTMTILKVMNAEGVENVFLPDYANSNINFAAGDFDVHDAGGWFDKMLYKAKPSVEVFYAIANGDWMPLECTENEELFHVNYGNVFTIELSQLDESVLNQWVNLKFVVTDEAGNSQVQELSNVFYVGQHTSVNEATTLTSTVYPNPFTNEVRINAAETVNGNASISVFNVLGEQVISKVMNCSETTSFSIDGSSLNAGIYFYSIATEKGTLQGRIVKE